MRISYRRNTGKVMSKITFLEDVNVLDKLERVSKRKMTSQSEVVRESLRNYLQNWEDSDLDNLKDFTFETKKFAKV